MTRLLSVLLLLLPTFLLSGQRISKEESGIVMTTKGPESEELGYLMRFQGIDYFDADFQGSELVGKDYLFLVKEIWNGEIRKIDTLVNSARSSRVRPLQEGEMNLKILAQKTEDNKLKMYFRFPQFSRTIFFDATESNAYSLRDIGIQQKIEPGKSFYAFAYILPYEKDGWQLYCEVDSSGTDVEQWGQVFGIEHYVVFEMKFE